MPHDGLTTRAPSVLRMLNSVNEDGDITGDGRSKGRRSLCAEKGSPSTALEVLAPYDGGYNDVGR